MKKAEVCLAMCALLSTSLNSLSEKTYCVQGFPTSPTTRRKGGVERICAVFVCKCLCDIFSTECMFFFSLKGVVNGALMDCASLMGSLAYDLGWCHAG